MQLCHSNWRRFRIWIFIEYLSHAVNACCFHSLLITRPRLLRSRLTWEGLRCTERRRWGKEQIKTNKNSWILLRHGRSLTWQRWFEARKHDLWSKKAFVCRRLVFASRSVSFRSYTATRWSGMHATARPWIIFTKQGKKRFHFFSTTVAT